MKFTPHPYQRYAVERIIQDPAIGLFQDMGLGKTVETLTAINDLRYNRWQVSRVLIVAPKKVAEATWQNEAQSWDHLKHLRIVSVLGTAKQRIKALYTPGDIWTINRENIPCPKWAVLHRFLPGSCRRYHFLRLCKHCSVLPCLRIPWCSH